MAKKRQKIKRFSIRSSMQHITGKRNNMLKPWKHCLTGQHEIARGAAKGTYDPEKPFIFADYPGVKSVMQA